MHRNPDLFTRLSLQPTNTLRRSALGRDSPQCFAAINMNKHEFLGATFDALASSAGLFTGGKQAIVKLLLIGSGLIE